MNKNLQKRLVRVANVLEKLAEEPSFWGIMGRKKGSGKMKPFDYKNGRFVTNVIYQTMWED